jgi:hypothetical protein
MTSTDAWSAPAWRSREAARGRRAQRVAPHRSSDHCRGLRSSVARPTCGSPPKTRALPLLQVLETDPANVKALYRRAQALVGLQVSRPAWATSS